MMAEVRSQQSIIQPQKNASFVLQKGQFPPKLNVLKLP